MLLQYDNYGFSVSVVFRSKAQYEGNGYSPGEYCNAATGHHRDALRVSLTTPTNCVAYMDVGEGQEQDAVSFAPLDKRVAIAYKERLAANVVKLTELAIIILKEQ